LNDWGIRARHHGTDPGRRIANPDVDVATRLSAADLTGDALILTVDDDLIGARRR
jgi:hypothetical protein